MTIITSVSSYKPLKGFGGAAQSSHGLLKPCSANCTKRALHVTSGITMALCLQLSSPVNARAAEEMVSVPRGALEELIVRDIATRVHSMDPSALAAFMDSLRSTSAPEVRSTAQRPDSGADPRMATRTDSQLADSSEAPDPPQPQPRVPEPIANSAPSSESPMSRAREFTSTPQAESSGAVDVEDVTSSLLPQAAAVAAASSPAEPRTRGGAALKALGSSVNAIAGLPVAIWAFLDGLFPEPVRAGQDLTEEVQRAVLVAKGVVLVVSSTLAYFLARGLTQQLTKAVRGIPFVRSIADASSAVAQKVSEVRISGSTESQEAFQQPKQGQPEAAPRLSSSDQPRKNSDLQNVAVPPVPNAQAAMLSAAAPQNAQRQPSRSQQASAGAADQVQPVRPSQPGPTTRSDDVASVPKSSHSTSPGILWKRTPGKGTLSSKWGGSEESEASTQPQVRVPNRQYELISGKKAGSERGVDRKPDDPWL